MERPFRFIESQLTSRQEFVMTEGRQPTYAMMYLKEGSFSLLLQEKESVIKKGDCCIFPDDVNFLRRVIEPIFFVYLKFEINASCPLSFPLPVGKVCFQDKTRFLDNMKKYESCIGNTSPHAVYYREHIIEDILLQASAEYSGNPPFCLTDNSTVTSALQRCHDLLIRSAVDCIREHASEKISIQTLCRLLNTNPSTLNFRFRKELSLSAGQFILQEKMERAARLLTNTTFSISQVASRCGYENLYYFSNAFKKYFSISPTVYRKAHRPF